MVPLADRRQWYRCHQLFGELLQRELGDREPELIPVVHRRAAAWHRPSARPCTCRAGRPGLQELVRRVQAAEQPYAVVDALAVLSLVAGDEGGDQRRGPGLGAEPLCGIVHLAPGRALICQGELTQAEEQLERALELFGIDSA